MGQLCQRRKNQSSTETDEDLKNLIKQNNEQGVETQNQDDQTSYSSSGTNKPSVRIALVGAQGAGKSTIMQNIKFEKTKTNKLSQKVTQEIGFYNEIEIVCWTVSEEDQNVSMNEKILKNFDAIAFVIDRTKRENLRNDGLLMRQFISSPTMLDLPILILINKSDEQGVGFWEVNQEIGLEYIQQREIHIQNCSGLKNEGIDVGINKLLLFVELLRKKKLEQALKK